MNESSLELKERAMRNRIVTAVKQRFSIRKLSIGAASVLLGTSLYFMGGSATIVHADTTGAPAAPEKEKTGTNDPVYVAKDSTKNDADVNNAIDKYAEYALEHDLKNKDNKVIIRPSDKQPVKLNTIDDRVNQVKNIQNDIQKKIDQANQGWDAINTCKKSNNHEIVDGKDSSYFENQSLSVDDEKDSEINQITVTDGSKTKNVNTKLVDEKSKNIDGLVDGISKNIDGYGINITHTSKITDKEKYTMKVNSNNKVIVDFQTAQCQGKETTVTKEITVTYDNLNNSYYLQNKTNRIKISRIDRTFSSIQVADNPHLFNPNGQYTYKNDAIYDKCDGPQLIIYNDPSDGFFYNNIKQISVKDTYYYDDKGKQTPINFDTKDPAWVFVTSLNSNHSGNTEEVRAVRSDNSPVLVPVNAEKIEGSTVTDHNDGWYYSNINNNFSNNANNIFGQKLDWDNNDEYNRFGFVGTVAFQYHPGMTLQYRADDSQWGSHWACMQTQVVSSLNENVIIYGHIKDSTENVTRNDTVTRTIHYLYDNGNTAQPDKTQTVSFNETGTKDDVTGETTWSNDNAQTVDSVITPSIVGYTPDKSSIEKQSFKFGDQDVEVTVTYHANAQTAKIIYIDDTTKNNLDSKNASGKFGQTITFEHDPTTEIANYKKQGYKLVSNDFNDNKYQADDSKNVFYVHFAHDTKKVSRNDDVNMTVHYVMDDGSEAPSDSKQTVSFTENGIQDLVTKKIDWTPAVSQTFKDVATKSIVGYTPDKENVTGQTVNFGDKDINVTVHYSANTQTATITYIDDTEKTTLSSDNQNGKFNQTITFEHDPAEVIKGFEEKGYVFVSNTFDNQKYQADNSNNVFEVHLKHGTKNVSRSDDVNMTVHYVMDDNSEAPSDNKQTLGFTENGIQDLVTKHIDWAPAASQTFKDVVTPKVAGYTPDQDKVTGQIVNFGDKDIEVTVTYSPNVQIGHINYIDDNTGKTLTRDDFSGRTNEHEDYTSTDRIQEFENKGYELVSNNYPEGGFNFDNNDQQDQVFNVHLKHGTVTVTTKNPQTPNTSINSDPHSPKYPKDIDNINKDVKRTIDYKFKDGKTAQSTINDSLHFERTVVIDKVTGDVLSDIWTPSQDFNDIQTPAIQGYTPDKAVVSDKKIGHDHQDIVEHVVYSPDAQHMTITYIDDTTRETLHTDNPNGVSDQDAKYTTSDTIKKYEDQHYKLVSDSTNGQDLIFDHDDNADQTYEVHFVHNTHTINQTTSPKQTIHYVYADDLARHGKAADDNVQQLSFKRDGYNDEVTGIDHWNAWTPANSQYEAVDSPVIQGYTPDKLVIETSTVNPTDKDTEITVVYNADKQAVRVIYVDKTTNDVLTSNNLSGKSDGDSGYNTKDTIEKYQSQHYVLTGDETNGANVIFDHDDQQNQTYYVYLVHDTQKVNRQDTVTSTIDYKFEDGTTAQSTVTQTKHFSENGVKDLVTGKTTWTPVAPQKFDDIATKSIVGYTPDKDNVAGSTVKFGDKDIEVTVIYHNNTQNAVITYIDDTEKKTLGSDKQNGKFDHEIVFEHDPAEVIKGLKEKGYKLVSDNFKPGVKYQSDNKLNTFEVHLVHTYEPVATSQTITETVHYIDANGKPVAPDHVATVTVKMTGTRDKVTNSITWNTPSTGHFDEVMSPAVPSMTPDKKFIPGRDVQYGDSDIAENVIYTLDEMPGEPGKTNKPGDSTPKTPGKTNKPGDSTPKTPGKTNKPGDSTPKTPVKSNKPGDSTPKTPGKTSKPGDSMPKTSGKTNKLSNEVSKHRGMIVETTIPEKHVDSRTADNQVSAKSTAKRELPQTGATINTGIWVGLAIMIASLGLLGASKKRKKK